MPFQQFQTIKTVRFIYEDDLYLSERVKYDIDYYLGSNFLMYMVFNFHPIHLFK